MFFIRKVIARVKQAFGHPRKGIARGQQTFGRPEGSLLKLDLTDFKNLLGLHNLD